MKIRELPFSVILELCRYLDNPTLPNQSWRGLLAKAPGNIYNALDVGAFDRMGNRPNSSPTEAVIHDFISRGFTVDDLYIMLTEIGHIEGRRLLKEYVSPHLLEDQEQPPPVDDSEPPPPSHELHPLYGYLPNEPPPVTSRGAYTGRKQEGTTASSNSSRPASLPANSDSGRRIAEDGPSVQNGPTFEQDLGRERTESGMSGRNEDHSPQFPTGMRNYSPVDGNRAPSYHYGAFSQPLTSTRSTSLDQYTSSSFSEEGMPCPPSQAMPSYTPSDQSDHSYPSVSTTPPSSIDVFSPNILSFSYAELSEVTGDFTLNIIGLGTFGTVFRAKIRSNGPFAIKKLHSESEMEGGMFYETFHRETFTQELQLLTKYNHRNILSLVAYSNDGPRPCLVYEYMENGSLAECLMGKRRISLLWNVRLKIANQIADALHFLHTVNQPKCLVHGDVKSANILLDSHLIPKLSDFGLARECHRKPSQQSTYSTQSKVVMGTMAYMAPEFLRNRKLTPKTDVYSFGVVLLELYTGLAADDPSLEERRILTQRLVHLFEDTNEREVSSIADVRAAWPQNVGFDLFLIATVCLRKKAKDRPQMDQVRAQLSHSSPEVDMSQLQLSDQPAYSLPGHPGTVATP